MPKKKVEEVPETTPPETTPDTLVGGFGSRALLVACPVCGSAVKPGEVCIVDGTRSEA